ncbi:MAG: hypothetical protein H8D45_20380 [Bacteroidetes bacterium]|nr:hypothetical protein [Bacteroidota bacterium]MBL7102978.1 hypothetical protein [Bacteroidales bacterium]
MKNLLRVISIVIIYLNAISPIISQDVLNNDTIVYPPDESDPYSSTYGWYLPVNGTLRILIVFAEIEYDTGTDPDPATNNDDWMPHSLPNWADQILDVNVPSGTPQGLLTRYYLEASLGEYNVLGDHLLAPNNGGVFKVLRSQLLSNFDFSALISEINSQMAGNFVTGHGLNNVSYFDNWTHVSGSPTNPSGKPKITPSTDNPSRIDHLMIIWRNHFYLQGTGGTYTVYNNANIVGYPISGVSINGSNGNSMPINTLRHEYAHSLYGGNNFHAGGGGSHENYFIPRSGGWSNLGLSGCSLLTWNGWDRHSKNNQKEVS